MADMEDQRDTQGRLFAAPEPIPPRSEAPAERPWPKDDSVQLSFFDERGDR